MKKVLYALVLSVALLLPLFVDTYYLHLLVLTGIYCILVLGLNIIMGYTGQASLAQASFYGIGAYASAILTLHLGLSFWVAMPLAALVATIISLFLGVITLRLVSHYFAICTFGLCEIIYITLDNWVSLTEGPSGIRDIRPPDQINVFPLNLIDFSSRLHYYYFVLFFVIATVIFTTYLLRSRTGRAFIAIRGDPDLAQAEGIYVMKYKVYSFVISGIIAAVAGCLFAHYLKFITPQMFTIFESLTLVIVLLIGGTGTIAGPILGSIINVLIPEVFNILPEYRMVVYGFFVIVFIVFIPEGLVGLGKKVAETNFMRNLLGKMAQPLATQRAE
jgi:branched-chain amino acid transport system permease protein